MTRSVVSIVGTVGILLSGLIAFTSTSESYPLCRTLEWSCQDCGSRACDPRPYRYRMDAKPILFSCAFTNIECGDMNQPWCKYVNVTLFGTCNGINRLVQFNLCCDEGY